MRYDHCLPSLRLDCRPPDVNQQWSELLSHGGYLRTVQMTSGCRALQCAWSGLPHKKLHMRQQGCAQSMICKVWPMICESFLHWGQMASLQKALVVYA